MKKILSFLLILMMFFNIGIMSVSAEAYYGNTNSNLKSYGISVKYNDFIYDISDNPNYYYTFDDYDGTMPGWLVNSHTIYKKDSSGDICGVLAYNAIKAPYLNGKNGYIYYKGLSPTTAKPGLYRIKTDGTNMERLASLDTKTYRGAPFAHLPIAIRDNYVFYCPNYHTLYRMSLDGSNKKKIFSMDGCRWIIGLSTSKNYIYMQLATNRSHYPDYKEAIYKISFSGSTKKCLYSPTNGISDCMYYNGYVFYQQYKNGYKYLYRMSPNGYNKKVLIKTTNVLDYCISNKKIYYTLNKNLDDYSENTNLRTCSLSGSNKKIILRNSHFYIKSISGNIVYMDTGRGMGTYNLSTKKLNMPY